MNLRSIDLNLLVVLDALLDERHVGRAAERIGLSQPAASAALARCRALFDDPLLERGRGMMRPTLKAEALRGPLKSLLSATTELLDPRKVPIAEIEAVVRITMADMPALLVIAPLLADLAQTAPGIDLVIEPWHGVEAATRALNDGATDLAVSVFPPSNDDLHRELLSEERFAIVMREGHPTRGRFNLDRWLSFPHVVVSGRGERTTPLDKALAERGLARRVGLVVPEFAMVAPVLRATDMIAAVPTRIRAEADGLVFFEPPIPIDGFELALAWHRRNEANTSVRHVGERLAAALRAN